MSSSLAGPVTVDGERRRRRRRSRRSPPRRATDVTRPAHRRDADRDAARRRQHAVVEQPRGRSKLRLVNGLNGTRPARRDADAQQPCSVGSGAARPAPGVGLHARSPRAPVWPRLEARIGALTVYFERQPRRSNRGRVYTLFLLGDRQRAGAAEPRHPRSGPMSDRRTRQVLRTRRHRGALGRRCGKQSGVYEPTLDPAQAVVLRSSCRRRT